MAEISIICRAQLGSAQRIDAEYYQPYYLRLDDKVRKFPNKPLKRVGVTLDCSLFTHLSHLFIKHQVFLSCVLMT